MIHLLTLVLLDFIIKERYLVYLNHFFYHFVTDLNLSFLILIYLLMHLYFFKPRSFHLFLILKI